ncbi:MAG TPA: PilZ domain-containing protein [Tepidisphaeraceae bacterium]|jgi:hypothetical protein|nr:PilZ domain-containing protein [Tepidisphaeraceae bacterium]
MDAAITTQPDAAPAATGASVNRRRTFRVPADGLTMKAWRMDPHERLIDRPLPSRRIVMSTIDLGRYGAGVVVPVSGPVLPVSINSPTPPALGDRWRLEVPLDTAHTTIMLEGRVASVVPRDDGQLRIGLAFREALSETQVRRINTAMDKLLATLQRVQLRRLRENVA